MSDHQHNIKDLPENKLKLAFGLTSSFMIIEFIGGWITGSLALISDAMHMLTDSMALLIAMIAIYVGKKVPDKLRSYGYARFEILAAAFNAIILLLVAFYILYEAYSRLSEPQKIQSGGMLIIATIGLIINLISMKLLTKSKDESLNVKGAYLEVWADMLGSVGVIAGSIIIFFTQWEWVDSIIAVLIGFMVFPRTWILLKQTTHILLEGSPEHINSQNLTDDILKIEHVNAIHDLHIWSINQSKVILTVHVVIDSNSDLQNNSINSQLVLTEINQLLEKNYDIHHSTIQIEYADKNEFCENND